jgi:myo-inositol-1(or 4)-monophosphatase
MRRKKSEAPYILHPMEAAVIVGTMTDDQNLIAAAALHDVVEDAGITIQEIEEKFGSRVRELVESETEDKRADLPPASTWRIRKEESLCVLKNTDDIAVLIVWLGDKLANMRSIYRDFKVEGIEMWQRFNQKDVAEQAWYYRSIVQLTDRLSETSAWLEYKTLTELVFGKGE